MGRFHLSSKAVDNEYATKPSAPSPTCTCSCSATTAASMSTVPEDVRKQRPWQGNRRDVEALKPEYRLALDRDGYVLVKCEHAVFKPEMCSA